MTITFWKFHTEVEELQRLSDAPVTEQNAENFLVFLDKAFPNKSWERHDEPRNIVEGYIKKLDEIQDAWSTEITSAITRSSEARWALASTIVTTTLQPAETSIQWEQPRKLSNIGVSIEDAHALAAETIDGFPNTENIKSYQTDHNIDSDGIVGIETYGEMYAWELEKEIRRERNRTGHLSSETQEKVITLLGYANIAWTHTLSLLLYIWNLRLGLEEHDWFDEDYKDFFDTISVVIWSYEESSEWQATIRDMDSELQRPSWDGRSMYRRIKDGMDNGNFWEEITSLIQEKWPMALFLLAGAFVFGMIPWVNNTVATNTWWKRLLVWGVALFNKESITDMAGDLVAGAWNIADYIRSPEAQEHFDAGKNWVWDLWITLSDTDTYGTSIDQAKEIFGNTVSGMETLNESFRESDAGKYIEGFTGKASVILSDAGFLNTSKEQILGITTLNWLELIMSSEGYNKLITEHTMADSDVAIFISEHMESRLADSPDNEIVRKTFFGSNIVSAVQEVALNSGISLNSNPNIHDLVYGEIATIANGRGSETLKQAANDIGVALQVGNFESFSLGNYNALDGSETAELTALRGKIQAALEIQNYITNSVEQIQNIEVKTTGLADTVETLGNDLEDLEGVKASFTLSTELITTSTLDASDYETSLFETAYQNKRLEILRQAHELWATTIGGIDISSELWAVEAEQEHLRNEIEFTELLASLTDVPEEGVNIITLRRWLDTNKEAMTQLGDMRKELELTQPAEWSKEYMLLQSVSRDIDAVGAELFQRYDSAIATVTTDLSRLEDNINAISWNTTDVEAYKQAKTQLAEISSEYDTVLEGIMLTWSVKTGDSITTFFRNLIQGNPTSFDTINNESNSIAYMSAILESETDIDIFAVKDSLRDRLIALETNLSVTVPDLSNYDVTQPADLRRIKEILTENTLIIDEFLDADLAEDRLTTIQDEVSKVEELFITALSREWTDEAELRRIFNDYKTEFRDFLEANGERSGNWFTQYFEEDRVEVAFNEVISLAEEAHIYSAVIDTDPNASEVKQLLVDFFTLNRSNSVVIQIWSDLDADATLTIHWLLEGLEQYTTEWNVLYIENEINRNLIEWLKDSIVEKINTLN